MSEATGQMDEAMVDEFDSVAAWTAEAVRELGPDHALPAACRGSGTPAALDWLSDQIQLAAGVRLLDVGAGVGGPAEYARRTRAVSPFLVDPMGGACRAASQLFHHPVAVANGSTLPFQDHTFDAAWSLGVLCTVTDKAAHLAELARVVAPGGGVGLVVFERSTDQPLDQPNGNHFPTHDELADLLGCTGLEVQGTAQLDEFGSPPVDWQAAVARVDHVVAERYSDKPAWQHAREQQDTLGRLIASGSVVGTLWACRRPATHVQAMAT